MFQQRSFQPGPIAPLHPEAAERFAHLHPHVPGKIGHHLSEHPLLTFDALADASARMRSKDVVCWAARNEVGARFTEVEPSLSSVQETIRHIGPADRYVMLRKLDQLPEYRELIESAIEPLTPAIRASTGEPLRLGAFLFVSAPGTLSPFHMDAEYNILFQIAGSKEFTVYPPVAPFLTDLSNERYHQTGDNQLPWQEEFGGSGERHTLDSGEALYVPYRWPHWVTVGDTPSISLSMAWCSRASYAQNDAYRLNGWLRQRGFNPAPPRPLPATPRVKSVAWRMLTALRLA